MGGADLLCRGSDRVGPSESVEDPGAKLLSSLLVLLISPWGYDICFVRGEMMTFSFVVFSQHVERDRKTGVRLRLALHNVSCVE